MEIETQIQTNIEALRAFRPGHPLRAYISYITFPRFKNLRPGTRIDFDFPISALVGSNGIGKTSVLHALWGAPYGYSTSRFWFETHLDPIPGQGSDTQRYFYGHWNESINEIVETRKNRVRRRDRNIEYWEPARIRTGDGMKPLAAGSYAGKSKDRWNPVQREVVYINLKAIFGGFDRYFTFTEDPDNKSREKIRKVTRHLQRIKTDCLQSFKYYNRERVIENRELSDKELEWVSLILGRPYESAHLVRHTMYPGAAAEDFTVIFKRGAEYSEAFAGSGELSVVKLVVDLLRAPDYALVLLDEPETSLHPSAQRSLLLFLLEQVKIKKLQIVFSTHSPDLVEGLPNSALHVFEDLGENTTRVIGAASANVAFKRLGRAPANRKTLLVEDGLAELIVKHAVAQLDPGEGEVFDVKISPGGAEAMLSQVGPASVVAESDVYLILDGDQRISKSIRDPGSIAQKDWGALDQIFKQDIGVVPNLCIPGGDEDAHRKAKIDAQLAYLGWLRKRLFYLPGQLPEELILEAAGRPPARCFRPSAVKDQFLDLLRDGAPIELSASDILSLSRVRVAKIAADTPWLLQIVSTLKHILI